MTVYELYQIISECPDEAVVCVDKGYTRCDVSSVVLERTWTSEDDHGILVLMING